MMLEGLCGGLVVAYILSLFGFDSMVVAFAKEMLGRSISDSSYYVIFGLIGAVTGAFGKA